MDEGVQTRKTRKTIFHKDLKSVSNSFTNWANDVALLFLESPVKFTDKVQPVCLPKQGEEIPVGKQCVVTGWGSTGGEGKDSEFPPSKELYQSSHKNAYYIK